MGIFFQRRFTEVAALAVAAMIWWPTMHLLWRPASGLPTGELDPTALPMATALESLWRDAADDPERLKPMRGINPEWDFMGRTFFLLGEANLALRIPERRATCLRAMDLILADTLRLERRHGMEYFLMDYHRAHPWVEQPPRSIFVDGEIALCLGARLLVEDDPRWHREFRERIDHIRERMERGPMASAESYPDECWMFCNTIALAALRMSEVLDGEDHGDLISRWLHSARRALVDPRTGLLISTFQLDGSPHPAGPGPEGSTIWLSAHMLQVIDPAFARDQYERAKHHLGRSLLGFGYSKEWPGLAITGMDVDSGPVLPVLGISASASGLALVGAAAFQDADYYGKLRTSLQVGAFPRRDVPPGTLTYLLAGAIGDPVIYYSTVVGPLWDLLTPAPTS